MATPSAAMPAKPTLRSSVMPAKPSAAPQKRAPVPSMIITEVKKEKQETPGPIPEKPQAADMRSLKEKSVRQLLQYETDVTHNLSVIVQSFFQPLLAGAETETMPSVSKAWVKQIFMNIEQIYQMNKQVRDMLQSRLANWEHVQRVGDIFMKMLPYSKIYVTYAANYNRSQEVFSHCNQDFQFQKTLEKLETNANSQLQSLMSLPLSIIEAYSESLTEILTKTESSHPDSNDLTAVVNHLEQMKKYIEQNSIASQRQQNLPGQRKMIHEGSVLFREAGDNEGALDAIKKKFQGNQKDARLQIYLFNDVLVHMKTSRKGATKSSELTWPLALVWIEDIIELDKEDPRNPYCFALMGPEKSYTLRFAEIHEKMTWMNRIRDSSAKSLDDDNSGEDGVRRGKYKFPDKEAGEFEGWWKYGKIHGEGVYKFCGNTYTGSWNYNQKEGVGTMECVSGEVYHGEWSADKPHGYGQLQYINRDRYDGEWKDGMRSGRGIHYFSNGDKYEGEWMNNLCHGEGVYTTIAGHFYCGGWKYGKMHGHGLLVTPNGRRYEGEFRDGQRWGEGKMDYANGDFYIGQWVENHRHGKGVFHSSTEGVYDGHFSVDLKEGAGVMHYATGDIYDGQWKKDYPSGQGTMHYVSGGLQKYVGQWESGLQNGKGALTFTSSAKYEGHFKDGAFNGHGKFIHDNAVVYEGNWKEGVRDGKGTLSVGPAKYQSTCHRSLMSEGKQANFLLIPDTPVFHFTL